LAKLLLGIAVAYLLLPFDLIPDFIPVIGHLDDVLVVGLLVVITVRLVPGEVLRQCGRGQRTGTRWASKQPGERRL
jgi:uncharacterized membrane protein YkvA (DUF1232 family)